MVSEFNKAVNIRAFLQLSVCVFRLICELIFQVHMRTLYSDALLDDAREYRCCKEILECMSKFTNDGKDADCITQH